MTDLVFRAMMFAREAHIGQVRKYTGNPYHDHLAEVSGIVATVSADEISLAVAWLHDTLEDCDVTARDLFGLFGGPITSGVLMLSELEQGNRDERKRLSRERLSYAPGWIQTIKCADLISNTSSIIQNDPKFAKVYLAEKRALLDVMTQADVRLRSLALSLCDTITV